MQLKPRGAHVVGPVDAGRRECAEFQVFIKSYGVWVERVQIIVSIRQPMQRLQLKYLTGLTRTVHVSVFLSVQCSAFLICMLFLVDLRPMTFVENARKSVFKYLHLLGFFVGTLERRLSWIELVEFLGICIESYSVGAHSCSCT